MEILKDIPYMNDYQLESIISSAQLELERRKIDREFFERENNK